MRVTPLLSQSIVRGARGTEQGFHRLKDKNGRTCALGAAREAVGWDAYMDLRSRFGAWAVLFWVMRQARCPVENCVLNDAKYDYDADGEEMITHLNDTHRWSRERIAAWVWTYEMPGADLEGLWEECIETEVIEEEEVCV